MRIGLIKIGGRRIRREEKKYGAVKIIDDDESR